MPSPAVLMALGASLVLTVADDVPTFDIKSSCKVVTGLGLSDSQSPEACIRDEESARAQLVEKWHTFPAADRSRCVAETKIGSTTPSYAEVLVCLQIAQDVKNLKEPVQ